MVVNAGVLRPRRTNRRARWFFWLLPALLLFGCEFRRDVAAVERLRSKIHEQVGREASVNVHTAYGSTTVTIRFEHLPTGDSKQLQERVEALTKAEFPQTDYVVVLGKP